MQRSSINKVSKRRQLEGRAYRRDRLVFLEENPTCQIKAPGCLGRSTQVSHAKGRVGKLFLDQQFWEASCDFCNMWLETAEGKIWGYKTGHRLDRLAI